MDSSRRRLLALCAALVPTTAAPSPGQGPRPRIVYTYRRTSDQLQKWYAEWGLLDGRDIDLADVDLVGLSDAQAEVLARQVLASNPRVIAVMGWKPVFLFQRLTSTVPLVFVNFGGDPVRMGLVESLRRPGRNMTGTCQQLMSLVPKCFELLREFRPAGHRGGVLITRATTTARHAVQAREETAQAAEELGIEIVDVVVPDDPTMDQVATALQRARVDFLLVPEDLYKKPIMPQVLAHLERIRLPALYFYPTLVHRGGLVSMSFDIAEGHVAAIQIIARILRGENPGAIPVYLSTRYHIAVNRRSARAMGLELPGMLLARADEVVE
jgi:putative tryptophan/tyrosine transport system substrate-binding protein